MNKKLFVLVILILSLLFPTQTAVAEKHVENVQATKQIEGKRLDPNAKILAAYLKKFDSPLQYHAQDFIDAAKKYDLDWKMLPAIAGVESTFGKAIPGGYNGWGWGVYGTQAVYFNSWTDAIFTIAKGLRENYLDRGLTDPYSINRAYAASPYWGGKVTYFMRDLEKFAENYGGENITSVSKPAEKIAVTSALLAFK